MDDVKGLLASRTVWAALIAIAAGVAGIFGYTISPEDQATTVELIAGIGATVGGLGAIWGRVKASKRIA